MAKSSGFCTTFALCFIIPALLILSSSHNAVASSHHEQPLTGWMPSRSGCRGTVGGCLAAGDAEEFDLDSEASRRILATTRYISYGALQRNSIPCSRRGASYYNCKPGAQANPYSRGCSAITHCRS
ncbi:rapid alkalinization factor-like [Diospyros lotus]|uniref:rapid alkalinization factor-like n=1 Tax=Diospyros lotus TaxID=55363 RepID=UPI00225565F0|nr:rapid alkalinization factor-like [Diospyros lotus]